MFIACDCAFSVWAGELVCGFRTQNLGSEETPPTCRIAAPLREQGESLGYGAETKRPPGLGDDTFVMSSVPVGSGETAVLQVERANSRR